MSVTIAGLLSLPSMREARVLGGHNGLQKTVNTISVMEYTAANDIQEYLLSTMEYAGHELVITCFANVKDDINAQCITMRRLAEVGEIGLVLYYVGIILPKVDRRLIELADNLDFPLICMPENKPNLRYSELISEGMDAIIKDQMTNTNFETAILDHISTLPVYRRSVGTAMGMLSDRLKISLALTDSKRNILNIVFWPRTLEFDIQNVIEKFDKKEKLTVIRDNFYIRYSNISSAGNHLLDLYVMKQDNPVSNDEMKQIINVMRICLNLWSQKYEDQVLPELVQAIMQDDPFRMRRIAALFRIDVISIHTMWIITALQNESDKPKYDKETQTLLTLVRKELSPYCKTIIANSYNQDVVAFMDDPLDCEMMPLADALYRAMRESGINGVVTVFLNLKDTAHVRQGYLQNKNTLSAARYIFPRKNVFNGQEIVFAEKCQKIISQGEEYAKQAMSVFDCLENGDARQANEQIETLTAFLLDAENSLDKCADIICLHRNSVKYRINQINDRLGFRLGHMPETIELYTAAAVRRILKTSNGFIPRRTPPGSSQRSLG